MDVSHCRAGQSCMEHIFCFVFLFYRRWHASRAFSCRHTCIYTCIYTYTPMSTLTHTQTYVWMLWPAINLAFVLACMVATLLIKWLLLWRIEPSNKPLWSHFVWRSEFGMFVVLKSSFFTFSCKIFFKPPVCACVFFDANFFQILSLLLCFNSFWTRIHTCYTFTGFFFVPAGCTFVFSYLCVCVPVCLCMCLSCSNPSTPPSTTTDPTCPLPPPPPSPRAVIAMCESVANEELVCYLQGTPFIAGTWVGCLRDGQVARRSQARRVAYHTGAWPPKIAEYAQS